MPMSLRRPPRIGGSNSGKIDHGRTGGRGVRNAWEDWRLEAWRMPFSCDAYCIADRRWTAVAKSLAFICRSLARDHVVLA